MADRAAMTHVFISYVRENGDIVDRLANELKNRGVTVWLDRNDIEPGARWRDAIKRAIRSGAFFLACFSKEYGKRDRNYMNEELTLAIDELRQRPSDKVWFIPVLINETAIPSRRISSAEELNDIQVVRLHENWVDGVRSILRVLKHDDPVSARVYYLIGILEQPFTTERLHALAELQALGPVAFEAVPAVIEALKDQDEDIRQSAAYTLQGIGAAAVTALVEALKGNDDDVRQSATDILREIGPAAIEAVPALADALKNENANVRRSAADVLERIGTAGSAATPAVPALTDALKDENLDVRRSAAEALWQIGPAAVEAVPALAEALKDQDVDVRRSIAGVLSKIGRGAAAVVPALAETLGDQNDDVRWFAVLALWAMGPAAADAAPALVEAAKAEIARNMDDEFVHVAAATLRRIGVAIGDDKPLMDYIHRNPLGDVRRSIIWQPFRH